MALRNQLQRVLPLFAWLVLAFMLIVILEGAVVRATGSGAGCGNHWPLCNGEVFPHHPRLATIIEFAHRSLTGILSTLVIALIAGVFYTQPKTSRARRAATWVGILLISEALLGALLVKGGFVEANTSNLRVLVQGIHLTNTMLLVAALTLTAWWLHSEPAAPIPGRSLATTALALTLVVSATGAVAALADTLFPAPTLHAALAQDFSAAAPLIIRMRWMHPAATVLTAIAVILLCLRIRSRTASIVASLLALQFVLGLADVLLLAPLWMQLLHLLTGDLFWIALVILASQTWRFHASPSP